MREELHTQDYDLICSTLVSGSYRYDNYFDLQKIESRKSHYDEFQHKPSSLVFIHSTKRIDLTNKYDYFIDLTGLIQMPSVYQRKEFVLTFNIDGSLRCMYQANKKLNHLKKVSSFKKITVFSKTNLFFEKQIRHLPCDNYLIYFGGWKENRRIQISLFVKSQLVIDVQIAHNKEEISRIYKQKYMMTKLSFYDFQTIDIPHEYFCKNQRIVINSVIHKSTTTNYDFLKNFSIYLTEVTDKTIVCDSIRSSKFYADMLIRIGTIQDKLVKEMLFVYLNNISMFEEFYFCLSIEKLEQQGEVKLVCSDLTEANFNAPMFSDFFFQIIKEIKSKSFTSILELQKYLDEQVELFGISSLVSKHNIDIQTYFSLFLIYFTSKRPTLINIQFLTGQTHLKS
jgi:hypothetical protein